jgi:hypothetical protein
MRVSQKTTNSAISEAVSITITLTEQEASDLVEALRHLAWTDHERAVYLRRQNESEQAHERVSRARRVRRLAYRIEQEWKH